MTGQSDDVVHFINGTSATREDLKKAWDDAATGKLVCTRPEIDDTTWLNIGRELSPDGEPVYRGTQAQIDQIVRATILSCVDQIDEEIHHNVEHNLHAWEVDGLMRAIEILEGMAENIRKTGSE